MNKRKKEEEGFDMEVRERENEGDCDIGVRSVGGFVILWSGRFISERWWGFY